MLVWLSNAPLPDLPGDVSLVTEWHSAGNPFVVRRQGGETGHLSLGFCQASCALSPRRIAVQARLDLVLRVAPPPLLAEIAPLHPGHFTSLSEAAQQARFSIRVFGSWMWQLLSGDLHATASSDLDVLMEVSSTAEADRAAGFLQQQATVLPFQIDGELSFPERGEVHWREFLRGEPTLLLKSLQGVRMIRRDDL